MLKIDPEFKSLIPPLREDELAALESSLLAEGCRDALITWQGVLIDGHNRYEICELHGINYRAHDADLESRLDVMIWMLKNQGGRRNLTDDQRAMLADDLREKLSERAQSEAGKTARRAVKARNPVADDSHASCESSEDEPLPPEPEAPKPKRDTRKEAAAAFSVPRRKVTAAKAVKARRPDLAAKVTAGSMSLAEAHRETKRTEVIEKLEAVEVVEAKAAKGVYDVLVIDSPWPMKKIERDVRPNQVEFGYPTMDEADLELLELPMADDCHVWSWTTQKYLPMALRLLEAWGLKYVCTFVWHKPGGFQPIGLPQYNAEFVLYARKGSPKFIDTKAFPVCFNAPRGKHSEKPAEFYDVVRRVTAGRRLDMFNRRQIDGFDGWGKEAADGLGE